MRSSTHLRRSVDVIAGGDHSAAAPCADVPVHSPIAGEGRACAPTTRRHPDSGAKAPGSPPVPRYVEELYWWAYVHPHAVRLFDRKWLVNFILLGNYRRLCDALLAELGQFVGGRTLQIGCVYGDLTLRLRQRLSPNASLDVVDVLPIQLDNLARKLRPDVRVRLWQGDAAALSFASASCDQVLLFFLLHEQPEPLRRATLREAMRIVKPGGRIVIVDYHQPRRWHPLRPLLRLVLSRLKPYAAELWAHDVQAFLGPADVPTASSKCSFFGGIYQKVVLVR